MSVRLGATYSDLFLNAFFRGVVGTPPSTVYASLGQSGSLLVPNEIPGITRAPVRINRGWISGTDSKGYPFQSTGTVNGSAYMEGRFDIYLTGLGANTYTQAGTGTDQQMCLMLFDAASAGNLLATWTTNSLIFNVINGDVVRCGRGNGTGATLNSSGVYTDDDSIAALTNNNNSIVTVGTYVYSMLVDWLFRGFNSVNQLYPPASFPNVYASIENNSGVAFAIPRLAVPRSTGVWNAPVDAAPGTTQQRKISNAVTFTFGAATAPVSTGANNCSLVFRMASTPQSFNDVIYGIRLTNGLTLATGDVLQITAPNLEVVVS